MNRVRNVFLLLTFMMPFWQGLYFLYQMYFSMVLMMVLFIACIWLQKGFVLEKSANFIFLCALFLLYLLSCFYAIDRGMAILGALKYFVYIGFYMLYVQLNTEGFKERVLRTIAISLSFSALLSILAYYIHPLGELWIQKNRLGGPLQYANTYALLLVLSCTYLIHWKTKSIFRALCLVVTISAIALTMSRSMIYMGAFMIAMAILITKRNWIQNILACLSGIGISIWMITDLKLMEVSRLADASLKTSEMAIRLLYYGDAIKMILKFPFGTGYLGYYYIQRTFQTNSVYFIKFVHSHLFQVLLDVGTLGILIFIIFFLGNLFSKKTFWLDKIMWTTLFAHALIDFDFEFGLVFFIVIILAIGKSGKKIFVPGSKRIIFLLILLLPIYIYFGTAVQMHSYKLYPVFTQAQVNALKNKNLIAEEKYKFSQEILERNQYVVEAIAFQRDYQHSRKNYLEAIQSAKNAVDKNPLNIKQVEVYSTILLEYAEELSAQGKLLEAQNQLDEIKKIPVYLEELAKMRITNYNVKHTPTLGMTLQLTNNNQRALELSDEIEIKR